MFTEATRARFPETHWVLLDRLREVVVTLHDAMDEEVSFLQTTDPVLHFNAFIDFGVSIYVTKLLQLFEALAHAIESERYLVYAQSGRAILENIATLRYYSRHPDLVAARQAWASSTLNDKMLRQANLTLDRFLRGTRFSWDAFIEGRMKDISKVPDQPHLAQINSETCLAKWFKASPNLEPLYHLLCDLVHPNQGSNLLVMGVHQSKLVVQSVKTKSTAMFIVAPTLAGILSTFKEFDASISALASQQLLHGTDSRLQ
jgi:hypothetical protein